MVDDQDSLNYRKKKIAKKTVDVYQDFAFAGYFLALPLVMGYFDKTADQEARRTHNE